MEAIVPPPRPEKHRIRKCIVIVDLHPARVIGGCENFLRGLCRVGNSAHDVVWYGSSFEFYKLLEVIYRALLMRASPLRLVAEEPCADVREFRFRDLIPLTKRWRRARALFKAASGIYCKNEFLELCVVLYFGGISSLKKTVLGMHTPLAVSGGPAAWQIVHRALYRNWVYRAMLFRVKALHAPSRSIYSDVEYVFGRRAERARSIKSRVVVIPNGVATGPLVLRPVGSDGLRLLAVGRISEQKGFDRLVPLLANGARRVTIIGDGNEAGRLRLDLGAHARFLGALDRRATLQEMRKYDVLLMPSRWENLPLTLLEAMSVGLFPVVQKLPHLVDQLPSDFQWLAVDFDDVGSVNECLDMLERLKRDGTLWDGMRRRLHAHVMDNYNEETLLMRLIGAVLEERTNEHIDARMV